MLEEDLKTQSLTIYLAKSSITDPRDLLVRDSGVMQYAIGPDNTYGTLYVQIRDPKPPRWAQFFNDFLPLDVFGHVTSAGALLVVSQRNRIFALSFGTGRFLLKPDSWEERFGLRVALNCIGDNAVKSIDKDTLDPIARHSREQTSRVATASEFGLDIEQDLLRAVTGQPSEPGFGKWVTGMDSFHVNLPVRIEDLPALLERVYEKHLDDSYQRTFPWIDHIAQVKDSSDINALNGMLVERLSKQQKENTWMAVPEVIQWADVGGFRFPGTGPRMEYLDIHLDDFLASSSEKSPLSEHLLETRIVECLDCDGKLLHKWRAYRCLYCELEWNGNAYLLNGGSWYRVQQNFVQQVNDAYRAIADCEIGWPEYNADSEGEYIKQFARRSPTKLAVMDCELIAHGGGSSKIEFCDIFTKDKDLIHIKRYGQSAALSHLFAQGLASGELFQIDPQFRQSVNLKLPRTHKLADPSKRPQQDEYRVVYAIVSDRPGALTVPFFSRINLKHAARRLQGFGFRVAKAKIPVAIHRAKLKKVKSRRRVA